MSGKDGSIVQTGTVKGGVRGNQMGYFISTNKRGTNLAADSLSRAGGTSGQTPLLNNSGRDYTILAQPLGCIITAD